MNITSTAPIDFETSGVAESMGHELTNDFGFRLSTYVVVFLNSVSAVLSFTLVLAIALPLLEIKKRTRALSFDLYLVFLSIADLVWAATNACHYGYFLNHGAEWDPTKDWQENFSRNLDKLEAPGDELAHLIYLFFEAFCLWIVAFLCDEILKLLKKSKKRMKSQPPTLQCVTMQGMVACGVGMIQVAIYSALSQIELPALAIKLGIATRVVVFCAPALYSLCVVFVIVKDGLLTRGAKVGNRLTVLVVYFFRIVLVYCVMLGSWIIIEACCWFFFEETMDLIWYIYGFVWGIQGLVSFPIILSKPDVGMMVRNLFGGGNLVCKKEAEGDDGAIGVAAMKHETSERREESVQSEDSTNSEQECESEHKIKRERFGLFVLSTRVPGVSAEMMAGAVDYLSDDRDDYYDDDEYA